MYEELIDKIAEYVLERKKRGLKSFVVYGRKIFNMETGEPVDSYFASAVIAAYPELDTPVNVAEFKIWKEPHSRVYPTSICLPSYKRWVLDYQGLLKKSLQTLKDKYVLYKTNKTETPQEMLASARKRKYKRPLVILIDTMKSVEGRLRGSREIRVIYRIGDPGILKKINASSFTYEMPRVDDVDAFVERYGPSVALQVATRE